MRLLAIEASQNGHYQHARYQQMAELGADLHVLNGLGTPDFWPAPRYRVVGSKAIDDLIDAARRWHDEVGFDGVLTLAESAVVATAIVAEALGLPGIGRTAARTGRNKVLMHEAHRRAGAPTAEFHATPTLDDALAAAEELTYPVVVKPALGAASNFVFRADDEAELRRYYAEAEAGSTSMVWTAMEADGLDLGPPGLLVESYLDGSEHLIEAVVWDGQVHLRSIVDRVVADPVVTFEDNTHCAPTGLDAGQVGRVHAAVAAAVRGQGLRHSVLHVELRFHCGRPYVLEVTPRPGGGGLEHMARVSAGYDPLRAHMRVAGGHRPDIGDYRPTGVHTATRAMLCRAGRIASISVPPEVYDAPELLFCRLAAAPGDVIRRPPEGNGIVGFLGATGRDAAGAMRAASRLAAGVAVTMVGECSTDFDTSRCSVDSFLV